MIYLGFIREKNYCVFACLSLRDKDRRHTKSRGTRADVILLRAAETTTTKHAEGLDCKWPTSIPAPPHPPVPSVCGMHNKSTVGGARVSFTCLGLRTGYAFHSLWCNISQDPFTNTASSAPVHSSCLQPTGDQAFEHPTSWQSIDVAEKIGKRK